VGIGGVFNCPNITFSGEFGDGEAEPSGSAATVFVSLLTHGERDEEYLEKEMNLWFMTDIGK